MCIIDYAIKFACVFSHNYLSRRRRKSVIKVQSILKKKKKKNKENEINGNYFKFK